MHKYQYEFLYPVFASERKLDGFVVSRKSNADFDCQDVDGMEAAADVTGVDDSENILESSYSATNSVSHMSSDIFTDEQTEVSDRDEPDENDDSFAERGYSSETGDVLQTSPKTFLETCKARSRVNCASSGVQNKPSKSVYSAPRSNVDCAQKSTARLSQFASQWTRDARSCIAQKKSQKPSVSNVRDCAVNSCELDCNTANEGSEVVERLQAYSDCSEQEAEHETSADAWERHKTQKDVASDLFAQDKNCESRETTADESITEFVSSNVV
jgi:hypothetical protein